MELAIIGSSYLQVINPNRRNIRRRMISQKDRLVTPGNQSESLISGEIIAYYIEMYPALAIGMNLDIYL